MKLVTTIVMVEEISPEVADKMREAFNDDKIKEDARVSTIEDMVSAIDIAPEDVTVVFTLEDDEE